jgi:hypothetical protein
MTESLKTQPSAVNPLTAKNRLFLQIDAFIADYDSKQFHAETTCFTVYSDILIFASRFGLIRRVMRRPEADYELSIFSVGRFLILVRRRCGIRGGGRKQAS